MLIPIDRIAADDAHYSQNTRSTAWSRSLHVRTAPPQWFSHAASGRTHDPTAARAYQGTGAS